MEKEIKYYTRSTGEQIAIKDMNTEHVINALSKIYREMFECKNKDEFSKKLGKMNDIKEDLYRRFNDFNASLGDD